MSPTITSPARLGDGYGGQAMTGVGMILGTAAYMSPEQAKGREADKRSDIWAFGCVLYEMLSGKQVFTGDSVTEVLARVLERAGFCAAPRGHAAAHPSPVAPLPGEGSEAPARLGRRRAPRDR
jgi:serine/threonine protein kinase